MALMGGGAFTANDELDAQLLAAAGATKVAVLPTADAFEHPERLVAAAMNWGERLGVDIEALMVLRRVDALDPAAAEPLRGVRAVYLVGDQPLHLRSVLKDTPLFAAISDVLASGALVAAVGGSAAALCDPMVDPRGGAFTIGLGMVQSLALATEAETWSPERLHRTRELANTTLAVLHTGDALISEQGAWRTAGRPEVFGDLPS